MAQATTDFFGDEALEDPADDALGYAPFAAKLAEALIRLKPKSGLVLALYGSWGGGKSTMLNFVAKDLGSRPKDQQPTIIRFNPWWFSGQENLVGIFFEELIKGLKRNFLANTVLEVVAPLMRILGRAVSKIPLMEPVGAAAEQLGNELDKHGVNTLTEAKAEIDDKLKQFPSSILVIIDDLDRLPADQIRQMFRLIKAVANFSKIIYLASFDKEIVMKALDPEQTSGESYIAKIVQIAFELPIPDRNALRKMLEIKLQPVLKDKLLDQREWNLVYGDSTTDTAGNGISHFIKTPRDVMRLTNYLSLTYPAVESEVNIIDFVIIETFRVFSPGVYDYVRRNQYSFCVPQFQGTRWRNLVQSRRNLDAPPSPIDPKLSEFHENAFKTLVDRALIKEEDKKPIQRLLILMFPILASIFPAAGDASNFALAELSQSRKRGIKDQDRFPYYFRLSPPAGGISQAEITSIMNDNDAFRVQLEEFAKPRESGRWDEFTKSESALAEISKNIIETTAVNNAKGMLVTALEFFGRGEKPWILESLVLNLLAKSPADSRFGVVRESIETTDSLEGGISLLRSLEKAQGDGGVPHDSDGQPLVSDECLKELQTIIASKIERAANEDVTFLGSSHLRGLLACWNAWGDRDSLKKWITYK